MTKLWALPSRFGPKCVMEREEENLILVVNDEPDLLKLMSTLLRCAPGALADFILSSEVVG